MAVRQVGRHDLNIKLEQINKYEIGGKNRGRGTPGGSGPELLDQGKRKKMAVVIG